MAPPGKKHDSSPTPDLLDRFHRSRVLDAPQQCTPMDHARPSRGQESTPNKVTARGVVGTAQAIVNGNRDHMKIPHGRDSYLDKVTGNGTRAGSSTRANPSIGAGGAGRLNDATATMSAGATKGSRRLNDERGSSYDVFNRGDYVGGRADKVRRAGGLDVAKHLNPKSKNARPHQKG